MRERFQVPRRFDAPDDVDNVTGRFDDVEAAHDPDHDTEPEPTATLAKAGAETDEEDLTEEEEEAEYLRNLKEVRPHSDIEFEE